MYDLILVPLAAIMVYSTAAVIKWAYRSAERLSYSLVIFVLTMMASMLASAAIYFTYPGLRSLEAAAGLSFTVMTAGLVGILYALLTFSARRGGTGGPIARHAFLASVIILALLNEILMGWSFTLISGGGASAIRHASGAARILDLSLNSYWFTLTMGAEMLLTLFYFRKKLPSEMSLILLLQGLIMLTAPPALEVFGLSTAAVYAGSAAMIALFIAVFEILYRKRELAARTSGYIMRLMLLYSAMMPALFFWGAGGSALPFGLTLTGEMVLYFDAVLRAGSFTAKGRSVRWQERPYWTFALLGLLFISEYFMAGIIDITYYGPAFLGSAASSLAPLHGLSAVPAALFDFIESVAVITDSPWFLIMMGIEMGALVLFQIRKVRQLETKVRLALVIVAYAIYTVFLPYFFYSPSDLPHIPFAGWNMGIGTSGAFAPAFMVAIGGTYLVSGSLAYLFGGRQVCSLFCSASLMYQGTFYDATKSFNRKSQLSRKTHGNHLGKVFGVTASLVWASIFSAVLVSYLDSIHLIDLSVFGVDPAVFAYTFYFNFLWYAVFISIPFVGNYACVTTGICHWGMFNQLVGRMGLFRLKVKDRYECVSCKTKDCALVCPVGLSAMPGKFIEGGEFRNYKCIGVGQCVSACPVDNIFFYDARHWVREKFGAKKVKTPGSRTAQEAEGRVKE